MLLFTLFGKGTSLAVEAILLVAFLVYVFFLCASRLNIKVLRMSAILIFLSGMGLYAYGFILSPAVEGLTTIILRSALSSVEMFVSHTDLLEIEAAQEEPFFLDLFIFIYACAVATSISAVLSVFGKRAVTAITLHIHKRRGRVYRHVFFSFDPNSMYLARNIEGDDHIAFIEFPSEEEVEKVSFEGILQNVLQGTMDRHGLDMKRVSVLKAKRQISEVSPEKGVLAQMGLEKLEHLTDEKTCFYLLSDDTEKNIERVLTLVKDGYFRSHTIHCHAHKDGLTRQVELSLFDTHVHFFYRNTMGVLTLREDVGYHPVSLLTVEHDKDGNSLGYVKEDALSAMIYGFGESGKEALKFLYRYGSLVRKDGSPLPLRCYVLDEFIDTASGSFQTRNPLLTKGQEIVYEKSRLFSDDFWKKIKERIDELRVVFFCLSDDKSNVAAATEVLDYAYLNRKGGLKDFKVFVRIVENNDTIDTIRAFYTWRAGGECMVTFGDRKELFSPKWTVSGNSIGVASHSAKKAEGMYYAYYKGLEMEAPSWKDRNIICDRAKEKRDYATLMQQVHLLRQYIYSASFAETVALVGKGYEDLLRSIPVSLDECLRLPKDQLKVIDQVSHTLHVYHCRRLILDGYVYGDTNDDIERRNHLLRPWEELSEKDRHQFRMAAKGTFIYLSENCFQVRQN